MKMTLQDYMPFDHVIRIDDYGNVVDDVAKIYAPEVYIEADWDEYGGAHVLPWHEKEALENVKSQGWKLIRPRRDFGAKGSPFLEFNEYLGGFLEEQIREKPGFYVSVSVEILPLPDDERFENESPEPYGWAVAYKKEVGK